MLEVAEAVCIGVGDSPGDLLGALFAICIGILTLGLDMRVIGASDTLEPSRATTPHSYFLAFVGDVLHVVSVGDNLRAVSVGALDLDFAKHVENVRVRGVLDSEVLASLGASLNAEVLAVLLHRSIMINIRGLLIVESGLSEMLDSLRHECVDAGQAEE